MTQVANPANKNSDALDIGLFDGIFTHGQQRAINLGGDNTGEQPKFIRWHKGEYRPVTVFTDTNLEDALKAPKGTRKVAWLLEPRGLRDTAYRSFQEIQEQEECFDYVIFHDLDIINNDEIPYLHDKSLWAPIGGSWVQKQASTPKKTKMVSMMTTEKSGALGHRFRHDLQHGFSDRKSKIDMYGRGSNPIKSKLTALLDYRYSVVVESCQTPGYFTEKLLDAFTTYTVPIYWGAPDIYRYFDPDGMLLIENIEDAYKAVESLTDDWYAAHRINILRNAMRVEFMRCAEDYAYLKYPWVFETE